MQGNRHVTFFDRFLSERNIPSFNLRGGLDFTKDDEVRVFSLLKLCSRNNTESGINLIQTYSLPAN